MPGPPQPRKVLKTPEQQAWDNWVRQQLSKGVTPLALTAQMVKKGWQRHHAMRVIESNREAYRPAYVAPPPPMDATESAPVAGRRRWRLIALVLMFAALVAAVLFILRNHLGV